MIRKLNSILRLLFLLTAITAFYNCSSTRKLENRNNKHIYKKLGLEENKKDNLKLYKEAASWLGVPHREGGMDKNGVDCSGLVLNIYKTVYNKTLERTSRSQCQTNCKRIDKTKLQEGDLVFFNTRLKGNKVNHVGIYLKDNKFLHTSSSKGVMVSSLDENFFIKAWLCGGRVVNYK